MEWIIIYFISIQFKFIVYLDWISLIFIRAIFIISSIVILYRVEYIFNDRFIKRFMILIIIFVISIILIIIRPNIFRILLGWDGLGLSSYCLVIYYQNKKRYNSGIVTIIINRVGDICILIIIRLIIIKGSLNFLFFNKINFLVIFLGFIASITKRAQVPFSSWLPLAIAAPTPISSLVHSSTLVTAGVYLLIRFSYLIDKSFIYFIIYLSCLTIFIFGARARFEYDLKKIIALSTLRQLGLIIFTISLSLPLLSFFHLITHAIFKSLLFLCSGVIIHNYFNYQDVRYISFIRLNIPLIRIIFNISSIALCGVPFLSGFYSKDFIIEIFNIKINNKGIFIIIYISIGFTILYSVRLIYFITIKSSKVIYFNFFYLINYINYSILLLLIISIFYGRVLNWLIFNSLNYIVLSLNLKIIIYFYIIIGVVLGLILSITNLNKIWIIFFFNYLKFFNLIWFLSLNFKKIKIRLFLINFDILILKNIGWLEYLSSKKIFYYLNFLFYKKKINLLNFIILIIILIYMLILIIYIYLSILKIKV